jgi:rubrerythrin
LGLELWVCPKCEKGLIKVWVTPKYSITRRGFTGRRYEEHHKSSVIILDDKCNICGATKKEIEKYW